jgi:hypothetical protein
MNDAAAQTKKPGFAARCARGLGTFNIAYGLVGLISAAILQFAFPAGMNPLPASMMVASSVASVTAITQGVLLRIYGPAMTGLIGRGIKALRLRSVALGRRLLSRSEPA